MAKIWFASCFMMRNMSSASGIAVLMIFIVLRASQNCDADSDFVFPLKGRNVSFNELQAKHYTKLGWSPDKCRFEMWKALSCRGNCKKGRDAIRHLSCYCDPLCREVGDCCYDYVEQCTPWKYWRDLEPDDAPKSCDDLNLNIGFIGYVLITGCSRNYSSNTEIARRCRAGELDSDIISGIPVFDMRTNSSYRNVYCAMCNNATHMEYWNFALECKQNAPDLVNNTKALFEYAKKNCSRTYRTSAAQKKHGKYCIINEEKECQEDNDLCKLCHMYSLPVYSKNVLIARDRKTARNPHCAVRRNITHEMRCTAAGGRNPPPALTILFDFKSSSKYRYSVYSMDWRGSTTTYKDTSESFSCDKGFAFDPLERKCKELPKTYEKRPFVKNGTNATSNSNDTTSYFQGTNCSLLMYNDSQVTFFGNGSIFIAFTGRRYDNGSYIVNIPYVIVCGNHPRNQTQTFPQETSTLTALQIITYVGHAISIISELILLAIYSCFRDLRNTPGRNLMCLVTSLLLFQVLFLLAGFNDIRELCVAMAILLHYFILTSFSWMAVMAYDVMKTFASKGPTLAGFTSGAFLGYCCFAFGLPLVIVLTTTTLDLTGTVYLGYGSQYCWISNTLSIIFVMHIPIGLVILFNIVALIVTIVAIERTKRSTRLARIDSGVHSPTLCVKLSVVLGITWLLGLVSGYADQVVALRYIYVILNSFQGFFICVAYSTNKRTIKLIKDKYSSVSVTNSSATAPLHIDMRQM